MLNSDKPPHRAGLVHSIAFYTGLCLLRDARTDGHFPCFAVEYATPATPLAEASRQSELATVWHQRTERASKMRQGEIGILRNVHYSPNAEARICYLVIEHESEIFIGTLQFDDAHTCTGVCRFIHEQIGQPIREIGSLDIPDSLSH